MSNEKVSFIDSRLSEELKPVVRLLQKIDRTVFRKFLKVLVPALEGETISDDDLSAVLGTIEEDKAKVLYAGLFRLMKFCLRNQTKALKQQEVLKEDLKELGFPEEFASDLNGVLYGNRRPQLFQSLTETRPRLPVIVSFRWRLDVAISTSVLNRVLEPSLLVTMVLSNGTSHIFEVPISKFHQLRYSVAKMLKEMEDLEKRSILSIKD